MTVYVTYLQKKKQKKETPPLSFKQVIKLYDKET